MNPQTSPRNTAILVGTFIMAVGGCGPRPQDTQSPGGPAELMGPVWQWQEFQDSAEGDEASNINVPDPSKFALTFRPDGIADIQADCNRVSWTYTLESNRLTFNTLGPSTTAHCGDESLDQRFLERLGNIASYVLADGMLYLNLKLDSGNMVFASGE